MTFKTTLKRLAHGKLSEPAYTMYHILIWVRYGLLQLYWFLIGAKRAKRDDKKMLAYIRIYEANKIKLNRLDIKAELRKVFKDERD